MADHVPVVAQPSGTVTLLFTDIEGSTRLLHELGEEGYVEALAEHRRLLREAFAAPRRRRGGYAGRRLLRRIRRRRRGASRRPREAQQALAAGPVRVRMGLHTGEPLLDRRGLRRASRCTARRGSLLRATAARSALGSDARRSSSGELRDLGEHRLKDFEEPVALFQLGDERFPPLKTISNTNLPRPASLVRRPGAGAGGARRAARERRAAASR